MVDTEEQVRERLTTMIHPSDLGTPRFEELVRELHEAGVELGATPWDQLQEYLISQYKISHSGLFTTK